MDNSESKLERSSGDVVHAVVKAGISGIPIIGGPATEIFSLIIAPPLTRRRDKWMENMAEGLKRLEEKVEGFKIEDLSSNDAFITTVTHASQAAIRNHQQEKLEALRNAVLNAALPNAPEDDLQLMFLEFVDSLTPGHLRVLKFLDNPKGWGQKHGITYPNWSMGGANAALEHAFAEFRGQRQLYDIFVKDLYSRGLLSTDSLHTTVTGEGMLASRTTNIGKQFIVFVTSPLED